MADTHAVGLKLTVFWADHPRVWLQQAEAPFSLRNITYDTKYHYVVAALDKSTAVRVIDILEDPPQTGKYANLKKRLTDIFSLLQRQRADRLLDVKCLRDRPSQLIDEMLALLGDHKPCMLFESLFLRCMPDDIRLQLVSNSFADMHALAKCADALWQARGQTEVPSFTSNVTDENHVEGRSPRDQRSRTTTRPAIHDIRIFATTIDDLAMQPGDAMLRASFRETSEPAVSSCFGGGYT